MRWKSGFIGSLVLIVVSSVVSTLARADNSPDVCGAVQAAFMTATNSQDTVYPKEVRAASDLSTTSTWHFEKFTDAMVADWQLREGELSDLASQENKYASTNFRPDCAWKGSPKSVMDDNDPMWVEFGNPVFSSSDLRLASWLASLFLIAVAVSGASGEKTCVLRKRFRRQMGWAVLRGLDYGSIERRWGAGRERRSWAF